MYYTQQEWVVEKSPIKFSLETYKHLLSFLINVFERIEIKSLEHGALLQLLDKLTKHIRKHQKKNVPVTKKYTLQLLPVEIEIARIMLFRYSSTGDNKSEEVLYAYLYPVLEQLQQVYLSK